MNDARVSIPEVELGALDDEGGARRPGDRALSRQVGLWVSYCGLVCEREMYPMKLARVS